MGGAARLRRAAAVVLCMVVVVGSESRLDLVYDADLFGAVIATVEAVAALSGLACVAFDGGEGSEYPYCEFGDDCIDCGPRRPLYLPAQPPPARLAQNRRRVGTGGPTRTQLGAS